eukprot:m.190498 g.190498  ORF g.190498 m.190498 type:complete len:416 (+) comp32405_c11_seq5:140-1387(+)
MSEWRNTVISFAAGAAITATTVILVGKRFRSTAIADETSPSNPQQHAHDENPTTSSDEESSNLLKLLYNIASEQAKKEGHVHRGITCNVCKVSPLRGIRYKCLNCVDYDVCEDCEQVDRHNLAHVFMKIRVPIPPLANPREAMRTPFYPGFKEPIKHLSWEESRKLQGQTHFNKVELEALYLQYQSLSTADSPTGGIEKKTFDVCLGPLRGSNNLITERFFRFFDHDTDGVINFTDLVRGLSVLCKGTQQEKIVYAFKGYDLHNKGYITRDELRKLFKAYFHLSMELVRDVVKAMEQQMMDNFNDDGDNPVSSMFTAPIPDGSGGRLRESNKTVDPNSNSAIPGQYRLAMAKSDKEVGNMMETMCDGAIEELIKDAFETKADLAHEDRMTFEEFKRWAATDTTIVAWFESLGSVF